MAVRSSVYRKRETEVHQHDLDDERHDADEDVYYRTCRTCGYRQTYEKMWGRSATSDQVRKLDSNSDVLAPLPEDELVASRACCEAEHVFRRCCPENGSQLRIWSDSARLMKLNCARVVFCVANLFIASYSGFLFPENTICRVQPGEYGTVCYRQETLWFVTTVKTKPPSPTHHLRGIRLQRHGRTGCHEADSSSSDWIQDNITSERSNQRLG